MKIGIIGYGSFGKLLHQLLAPSADVIVHDQDPSKLPRGLRNSSLDEIAEAKLIIIAVNIHALETVAEQLKDKIGPDHIVADVCSVKLEPIKILDRHLKGKCQILATHPLFGPQSIASDEPKKLVVCKADIDYKQNVYDYLRFNFNVNVIEMTAEEHDRQMAWVHSLTFFVGRSLLQLDPPKSDLSTAYYQKLLDLVELERNHTLELFYTVNRSNPFAVEIRKKFIDKLQQINEEITQ